MIHFTRCHACECDGCYDEPTEHPWWDADDVAHARATGHPDPVGLCACVRCGDPPSPDLADRAEDAITAAVHQAVSEGRIPTPPPVRSRRGDRLPS